MFGMYLCEPELHIPPFVLLIVLLLLPYSPSPGCPGTSDSVSHTKFHYKREPTLALFWALILPPASALLCSFSLQMFVLLWFFRSMKLCTFSNTGSISGNSEDRNCYSSLCIQVLKQYLVYLGYSGNVSPMNEYGLTQSNQKYSGKSPLAGMWDMAR